jgi:GNAT superfamily N-acetyltransferase
MSEPRFEYSRAKPSDATNVHGLLKQMAAFLDTPFVATVEDIRRLLGGEHLLQCEPGPVPFQLEAFIAWRGSSDLAVGILTFHQAISTYNGKYAMYVEDIYVDRDFWKNGVGEMLVSQASNLLEQRKWCRMEWHAPAKQADTISFYKNLGATAVENWMIFRGQNWIDMMAAKAVSLRT